MKITNKLMYFKKYNNHVCPICTGYVYESDEFEIVVTKRKTCSFYHSSCLKSALAGQRSPEVLTI